MRYAVRFTSSLDRPTLHAHIDRTLLLGPFVMTRCDAVGQSSWELEFAPRAAHLVVSFTKFAELQLQLARCGEIVSLHRADSKEQFKSA